MASLEGLPPLPKSLSGLNLLDYNSFQSGNSPYSFSSDRSENNVGRSYSISSENGNFITATGRTYSIGSTISSDNSVLGRNRTTPPLRDLTPSTSFKQLSDTPPMSSARASPIINSSRNTPLNSARASPVVARGSTPPTPNMRGSTPPIPGLRGLPPPPPPPRQHQVNLHNGIESSAQQQRSGRLFNLDTQLATLRKEMVRIMRFFSFFRN